jgi:hypothetical protein
LREGASKVIGGSSGGKVGARILPELHDERSLVENFLIKKRTALARASVLRACRPCAQVIHRRFHRGCG